MSINHDITKHKLKTGLGPSSAIRSRENALAFTTRIWWSKKDADTLNSFQLPVLVMQVRYCSVRRQTTHKPGQPELQVLDYENVTHDLLPLVASAYALIFMVP